MKALRENGFRVPEPIAQNRHTVVMELVEGFPLRQVNHVPDPAGLYAELIAIVMRLAAFGLIHGDFNEFNVLIREDEIIRKAGEEQSTTNEEEAIKGPKHIRLGSPSKPSITLTPVIIDFPQMVSIDHPNAQMYFDRDINCVKRFFERRFNFTSDEPGPIFQDARELARSKRGKRLDVEVEASGFSKKMAKELEKYMQSLGNHGDREYDDDQSEVEDDSDHSSNSGDLNDLPGALPASERLVSEEHHSDDIV